MAMARRNRTTSIGALGALVAVAIVLGVGLSQGENGQVAGMPASVSRQLGPAPLILTLHGSLLAMLSAPGIDQLAALEGQIAQHVRGLYGPVSWLRGRLSTMTKALARDVSSRVSRADLLVRYGATGRPSIDDQSLVTTLVFGARTAPLPSVRWLFPAPDQARIFVRTTGSTTAPTIRELEQLVARSGLEDISTSVSRP
jgi:hypothetical protein